MQICSTIYKTASTARARLSCRRRPSHGSNGRLRTEARAMAHYAVNDLRALIKDDRIHRNVFVDPDIFALEMERVFARFWIFVAHESQIANPGDFFSTRIGTQSVVAVRHTDGKVRV